MDRRAFLSLIGGAAPACVVRERIWAKTLSGEEDLTSLALDEATARVRSGEISPVELTKACLARIDRHGASVNAFLTLTPELALAAARAAEREIRNGAWRGPLHGIPITLKDQIDTANVRTTKGSMRFIRRVPAQDAHVVARLKQAGAVLLGKLNMGVGIEGWGPVRNPWAREYECGYSSSGAGAAVAADFCFGALGTDGAGSVRIPASACGVVGLKPTYGLVSNRGANEHPTGHVGPLCKTVLDAALLLEAIAGYDSGWPDSAEVKVWDYAAALRADMRAPRLGIPKGGFFDNLDPEIAQLMDAAIETISTIGTVNNDGVSIPLYWEIYQGLIADPLSSSYANAQRALQEARKHAANILGDDVDLLILPTWKRVPMTIDERRRTWPLPEEQLKQELWNTLPFNVLGLPAISVPCGFTQSGLPVGVQIVGRPFAETQVLAFAHAYEQATTWHSCKPKLNESKGTAV